MSAWIQSLQRHWSSIVTIGCIIAAGIVEALQQAVSGAPSVSARIPWLSLGGAWHYVPLTLLCIAGIVWLVGRRGRRTDAQLVSTGGITNQIATQVQATVVVDVEAYLRLSYRSALQETVENNLRASFAAKYGLSEREDKLYKAMATGLMSYQYEITWMTIYRSQVLLLTELNQKGFLGLDKFKPYYEAAATEYPSQYANYTFQQWLSYLSCRKLILAHPNDIFEITVGGKDFLKYMVHHGHTAEQKPL